MVQTITVIGGPCRGVQTYNLEESDRLEAAREQFAELVSQGYVAAVEQNGTKVVTKDYTPEAHTITMLPQISGG